MNSGITKIEIHFQYQTPPRFQELMKYSNKMSREQRASKFGYYKALFGGTKCIEQVSVLIP